MEYNPDEYPLLVEPIFNDSADVVYGSRFRFHGGSRVLFFRHMMGNRFLTFLSNLFTDLALTDMETCYKVFKRNIIEKISIEENGFWFEPEITAKIAKLKCRVFEVGISYYAREYAEGKKNTWKDGFWAIWCIVKYNLLRT